MITDSNVNYSQQPKPAVQHLESSQLPTFLGLCDRWAKTVDNSRYLQVEHKFKEKEYGIKWRTAFELRLEDQYLILVEKFGNPCENDEFEKNMF